MRSRTAREGYSTVADRIGSSQSIATGLDDIRGFEQLVTGITLIVASALLLAVAVQTIDAIDQRRRDTAALIMAGTPGRLLRYTEAVVATAPTLLAFVASFLILVLSDLARSRVVGAPLDLDTDAYLIIGLAAVIGIAVIGSLATIGIPSGPPSDALRYE